MNLNLSRLLLRIIIVIIIIIGGVIIIVLKPIPEPECLVCGERFSRFLGISQVILGAAALILETKIFNTSFKR